MSAVDIHSLFVRMQNNLQHVLKTHELRYVMCSLSQNAKVKELLQLVHICKVVIKIKELPFYGPLCIELYLLFYCSQDAFTFYIYPCCYLLLNIYSAYAELVKPVDCIFISSVKHLDPTGKLR